MSEFTLQLELDMDVMQSIFGQYDSHIAKIEKQLGVMVLDREGVLRIKGEKANAEKAEKLILSLA